MYALVCGYAKSLFSLSITVPLEQRDRKTITRVTGWRICSDHVSLFLSEQYAPPIYERVIQCGKEHSISVQTTNSDGQRREAHRC